MSSKLIDIHELADQTGLAVPTLYNWRTRKIGPPAIRLGNRVRYRQETVDQWIREQETLETERRAR